MRQESEKTQAILRKQNQQLRTQLSNTQAILFNLTEQAESKINGQKLSQHQVIQKRILSISEKAHQLLNTSLINSQVNAQEKREMLAYCRFVEGKIYAFQKDLRLKERDLKYFTCLALGQTGPDVDSRIPSKNKIRQFENQRAFREILEQELKQKVLQSPSGENKWHWSEKRRIPDFSKISPFDLNLYRTMLYKIKIYQEWQEQWLKKFDQYAQVWQIVKEEFSELLRQQK